ncbi:MAG: hypothetical protein GIW99_05460 [Candidatus Eremiobacteraeota bacterium]|nr:hypothetical protein [Candidatus Eremiobacteraeota bacterium]MBC5827114.1 hypothetical protein [Candidatus Eremiobacteraeota bacterium]
MTEFGLPNNAGPLDIATGSDGALWFTEETANKIGRMGTGGSLSEFPIPTADSLPFGLTSAPDGGLWFTENNGDKIGRIHP